MTRNYAIEPQQLSLTGADMAFKESGIYSTIYVPSDSPAEDAIYLMKSEDAAVAKIAQEAALAFSSGSKWDTEVVVFGPSSAKTAQVIKDAFWILDEMDVKVPKLKLMFMGSPRHSRAVREMVEARGAQYLFRSYEGREALPLQ